MKKRILSLAVLAALYQTTALAGGVQTLEMGTVVVEGEGEGGLAGTAESATVGTVTAEQLENRPIQRPGELIEVVPGLIVSQHSGEGKANQYYLRGFNLDHGTDIAISLDGVPVNQPTHGHGQGWADLNFLIPELVEAVQYKKGPYYAEVGDFSSAGAVDIHYANTLKKNLLSATVGQYGYYRLLGAQSGDFMGGKLLYALELGVDDGPWDVPQDLRKLNSVIRYSRGDRARGMAVTAMAYDNRWTATDQIPQRAVDQGIIGRFGSLDPTDGGIAHRLALSAEGWNNGANRSDHILVYAKNDYLNLYSNFTYYMEDPVNGDQFQQVDDRRTYGLKASRSWLTPFADVDSETEVGVQVRYDDIDVSLHKTKERQRLSTVRADQVGLGAYGVYAKNDARWNDWLRTIAGIRADLRRASVDSNLAANSGDASESLVSPKLSVVLGPWSKTEYFVNVGRGYHSNDARGATMTVDPTDLNQSVDKVDLLVPATGFDLGLRTAILPKTQLALALWRLDMDSELLFVGDAGMTEPSRPSRRTGIEASAYVTPARHVIIDADLAYSQARFTDNDPAGDRIPGAVEGVASAGLTYNPPHGWNGGLRLRYFGPRPLVEDNSVRSEATFTVSTDVGYRFKKGLEASLEIINLFDAQDSAIDYYYESQLKNETSPQPDIHFHPVLPRMVRASLVARF